MTEEDYRAAMIQRMDVLIPLLLDGMPAETESSNATRIERLTAIGLSQPAVAKVIGKPLDYVTATMSQRRQSAARRKKNG